MRPAGAFLFSSFKSFKEGTDVLLGASEQYLEGT